MRGTLMSRVAATALVAAAFLFSMAGVGQAAVSVSDLDHGVTATDLGNSLVGSGVTISNVTYTGDNRAAGTFSAGAPSIGFDDGIVLDSGKVQTVPEDEGCSVGVEGPNTCFEFDAEDNSTVFDAAGDSDLTSLSGNETSDAAVLEFDFVPQLSTVQFNYVFSSDEYNNYANTEFNDVFGFFINGTNCALVPETSDPVSINTINNGNPGTGEDPTPHHPELFRDNVRPSPTIDSQMDGLTVVLTCSATVNADQTNHMKLAIADATDSSLDSAVFLQGGSFTSDGFGTTSARGTANATLDELVVAASFSAITNCDEALSTRPFYVRWSGTQLFKKDAGAATTSTCVTEGGTKVNEGTATGTVNGTPGATVEWSFVDGVPSPDNVNITVTAGATVLDIAGAPAPLSGSPGGVWAFETSPWPSGGGA